MKQALDDSLRTHLCRLGYSVDDRIDNAKMLVMVLACAFASAAQFGPVPFPEGRWLLGGCVGAYFACSGLLSALLLFWEKDLVYTSEELECAHAQDRPARLLVHTRLPRFEEDYVATWQAVDKGGKTLGETSHTWSVGLFFTAEGFFDERGFERRVEEATNAFWKKHVRGGKPKVERDDSY